MPRYRPSRPVDDGERCDDQRNPPSTPSRRPREAPPAHPAPAADRTYTATTPTPATGEHWAGLVDAIDPRITTGSDWPALAKALDRASESGYPVADQLPRLAAERGLPVEHPGRALRDRLINECAAAATPLSNEIRAAADAQRAEAAKQRLAHGDRDHDNHRIADSAAKTTPGDAATRPPRTTTQEPPRPPEPPPPDRRPPRV